MDPLLEELVVITRFVNDMRKEEILKYFIKCLDSDIPSDKILLTKIKSAYNLYPSIPKDKQERFEEIIKYVLDEMIKKGYRADYRTPQEEKLKGSTEDMKTTEDIYKPIGITNGTLTIKEARRARELAKVQTSFGLYFNLAATPHVRSSLESLDKDGNTIRDPRLVDENFNPIPTTYSDDFPGRREQKIKK